MLPFIQAWCTRMRISPILPMDEPAFYVPAWYSILKFLPSSVLARWHLLTLVRVCTWQRDDWQRAVPMLGQLDTLGLKLRFVFHISTETIFFFDFSPDVSNSSSISQRGETVYFLFFLNSGILDRSCVQNEFMSRCTLLATRTTSQRRFEILWRGFSFQRNSKERRLG